MTLESLKVRVIQRAWSDPVFKQNLITDPKKTLQDEYGVQVPDDVRVTVAEESATSYYLVLPPKPEDILDNRASLKEVW